MSLLGLVYLPDPSLAGDCENFASALTASVGRRSCLGTNALAHVTLVHVRGVDDASAAWRQSVAALPHTIELDTAHLYFAHSPSTYNGDGAPDPGVMAGLAIIGCSALSRAERQSVSLDWVQKSTLMSSNGSQFFPHITLGVMDEMPTDVDLQASIFRRTSVGFRLAMGPIGPHGVFQRIDYI